MYNDLQYIYIKLCDVHVMVVHKNINIKTKTTHSHGKTTSNIVVMSEKYSTTS